jgi:hypothetical protein
VDEADLTKAMEKVGQFLEKVDEPHKVVEIPKSKVIRKGKGWVRRSAI